MKGPHSGAELVRTAFRQVRAWVRTMVRSWCAHVFARVFAPPKSDGWLLLGRTENGDLIYVQSLAGHLGSGIRPRSGKTSSIETIMNGEQNHGS